MPKAKEGPATRTATPGAPGEPQSGGPQGAAPEGAVLLSKEAIGEIGEAIGGRTHWQASAARRVGVSKSQMTRYLNGDRTPNTALADAFHDLMLDNIAELGDLMSTPGLPHADEPIVAEAQALIKKAVYMMRYGHRPKD
uniref:HTH cro/C1-type domain-containing protein n=1 Tax=Caulobacter phage BL57 TaxID=3348355 RepID=A0AB74UKM4_9VIRU